MNVTMRQCAGALALMVLTACSGTTENEVNNLFPITEYTDLTAIQICPDIMMQRPNEMLVVDNRLLIKDMQRDSLLHIIDLNQEKVLKRIAPVGQGPFDFLFISTMHYDGEVLAINDMQKRTMAFYRVQNDNIQLDANTQIRSINLRGSGNYPFGDDYVSRGIVDDNMIIIKNAANDTIGTFGKYPGDTIGIYDHTKFSAEHTWNIITSPKKDRVVVAGGISDWLAFYKAGEEAPQKIKEYFTFETTRKFEAEYDGDQLRRFSVQSTDETFFTYSKLYASDHHLYTLYSGYLYKDMDNPDNTCYIMQFSWDGEFQKAYHLQEVISHFAVDETRNCIYATYTPKGEDPLLLKYDIK